MVFIPSRIVHWMLPITLMKSYNFNIGPSSNDFVGRAEMNELYSSSEVSCDVRESRRSMTEIGNRFV